MTSPAIATIDLNISIKMSEITRTELIRAVLERDGYLGSLDAGKEPICSPHGRLLTDIGKA